MTEGQINALSKTNKAPLTTTFYSTASGYITQLGTTEGAYLGEGTPIIQLADLSSLWAEAQVYSSQLSTIPHNGMATVRVSGLEVSEYKGRISFANPEVSPNSRINLVRVTIPNPGNKLKPGMFGGTAIYLSYNLAIPDMHDLIDSTQGN